MAVIFMLMFCFVMGLLIYDELYGYRDNGPVEEETPVPQSLNPQQLYSPEAIRSLRNK